MSGKVILALSGGVDSSVAALLLKRQGHAVEALFMKNWNEPDDAGTCPWEQDVDDALAVCDQLDIPLNTVDLSREYRERVFAEFVAGYAAGRTPNPDVLCNQEIKFNAFLEHALRLGADQIATGHYARVKDDGDCRRLLKAVDADKDQSYFLSRLSQQQLRRTLFPIGEMRKPDVRALAEAAGLKTFAKKDSTGICFIGEQPFRDFLARWLPRRPGVIRSEDGSVVGEHEGAHFYTPGQRKGLGIGGVAGRAEAPWYVIRKDVETNELIVTQDPESPLLYCRSLRAGSLHWINAAPPDLPLRCAAKIRYRQADQPCLLETSRNGELSVAFDQPQRAVAAGQYVVFYDGEVCLGSGVISS
jgi:tRNA-specific 2-thiouridylase